MEYRTVGRTEQRVSKGTGFMAGDTFILYGREDWPLQARWL